MSTRQTLLNEGRLKFVMVLLTLFIFIITLYSADKELRETSKCENATVCIGSILNTDKIQVVIYNHSGKPIKSSSCGTFGNTIYLKRPSGKLLEYIVSEKLPKNFQYSPDIVVKPYSTYILNNVNESIIDLVIPPGKLKPGKYILWLDLINWIDFKKGKFEKYTSNKLTFFVQSKGKK